MPPARETVDLLITNIGQLCTIPPHTGNAAHEGVPQFDRGPQRGHALGNLGLIEGGALAVQDGVVVAAGPRDDIEARYHAATVIDASGGLVTPGLVDPHTHLIWAGDRAEEFERRIAGATYQEIMAEGGGIVTTMRATREAGLAELVDLAKYRLDTAMQHGTTTLEIKTGYGLQTATEIKMLNAIALLDAEHPVRLVPTFLGAHAIPPEFAGDSASYVDLVIRDMLPEVIAWRADHWPGDLFCDVFCEDGAFSLDETRRILTVAKDAGLKLKIHVDEFAALGGTTLGVELGATSLDHLDVTPEEEIMLLGQSDTAAVLLPTTPFGLGLSHYPSVQQFLDAGAILALATDCNPGPAWTENMQAVMTIATRYLRLTPARALVASTLNAAHALALSDRVGSLTPGYAADIVIWQAHDYRELGYHFGTNLVEQTIIGGEVVYEAN